MLGFVFYWRVQIRVYLHLYYINIMRPLLIYYPGMISLILIPYLISYLAIRYIELPQERIMELNMPLNNTTLTGYSFDQAATETKIDFLEIKLTGNAMEDKIKLDFVALETRRIITENDSVQGLKIIFNDTAKYNSLIRILNIMDTEVAGYYVYWDQIFWFYHIPVYPPKFEPNITIFECGYIEDYGRKKTEFPFYLLEGTLIQIPISLLLITILGIIYIILQLRKWP